MASLADRIGTTPLHPLSRKMLLSSERRRAEYVADRCHKALNGRFKQPGRSPTVGDYKSLISEIRADAQLAAMTLRKLEDDLA